MIQTISRPSVAEILRAVEELRPTIDVHRAAAEAERRMPRQLVETLRAAGLFKISTPAEHGGWELPLADVLEVYEALGRVDAVTAWVVWNGNIGFAAAMLDEAAVDRVWSGVGDPIIANSARVAGAAVAEGDGFRLSGRWDIVSAIDVADWVALFGVVMDGSAPRIVGGAPDIRVFFLPIADVQIVDTWHTSGMRGTGSNSVVVDAAFVPGGLAISPFATARIDRPLFRIPAFTLASSGAAPIVIGIAQAALDELIALAPSKPTDGGGTLATRPHVQHAVAEAMTSLHGARLVMRDAARAIDEAAEQGEPVTELLRARARAAMSHAASVCRGVLATCQLLASSTAVYTSNRIEAIVRDGQVALQHMILSPSHLDILGRLTLGQDAGTPVV